jgi:serine protease Do
MASQMLGILLAMLLLPVQQPTTDVGQSVFAKSQQSVFLVYVVDSAGHDIAFGTGFQIASNLIATNAHVVADGKPQVEIGPVRLDAKVVKLDVQMDLAVLQVDAKLISIPLQLSSKKHAVGEVVYAIGNPEGLEKTFSQGVIAGFREEDGRSFIQVTTPISHGSSGGPILDRDGAVVGIATAYLEGGQNLNFAVPSSSLSRLLSEDIGPASKPNVTSLKASVFDDIRRQNLLIFSPDKASEYQQLDHRIDSELESLISATDLPSDLFQAGCTAIPQNLVIAKKAFEKGIQIRNSEDLQSGLALVGATLVELDGIVKPDDVKTDAADTLRTAAPIVTTPSGLNDGAEYAYALASLRLGNYSDAYLWYQRALSARKLKCGDDLNGPILRGLVESSRHLDRFSDSDHWFLKLQQTVTLSYVDWSDRGDELHSRKEWDGAAPAHETSASLGYPSDYCRASMERYFSNDTDIDSLLTDGRACDKASESASDKDRDMYSSLLPTVHVGMAWALNARGVYSDALANAKDAVSMDPANAFAFNEESKALTGLGRTMESISAAEQAVRLSDGKYADMQFQLGSAYFDAENWVSAERAFEQVANMDRSNFSAAFNIALCLQRQSYFPDARRWYEDAIKIARNDEERSKAQSQLNALR